MAPLCTGYRTEVCCDPQEACGAGTPVPTLQMGVQPRDMPRTSEGVGGSPEPPVGPWGYLLSLHLTPLSGAEPAGVGVRGRDSSAKPLAHCQELRAGPGWGGTGMWRDGTRGREGCGERAVAVGVRWAQDGSPQPHQPSLGLVSPHCWVAGHPWWPLSSSDGIGAIPGLVLAAWKPQGPRASASSSFSHVSWFLL